MYDDEHDLRPPSPTTLQDFLDIFQDSSLKLRNLNELLRKKVELVSTRGLYEPSNPKDEERTSPVAATLETISSEINSELAAYERLLSRF